MQKELVYLECNVPETVDILREEKKTDFGNLQGTVLEALLFIIYRNHLFDIQPAGHIPSYEDDTVILYAAR